MTDSEKMIIEMLVRMYWLVTQAPGVARYAKDVKLFAEADTLLHPDKKEWNDNIIAQYDKR